MTHAQVLLTDCQPMCGLEQPQRHGWGLGLQPTLIDTFAQLVAC